MVENLILKKDILPPSWDNVTMGQLVCVKYNNQLFTCLMTFNGVISLDNPRDTWFAKLLPDLVEIYPMGTKVTYIS